MMPALVVNNEKFETDKQKANLFLNNLTNFADEIYKYKVSVSCSLSLFVGLTQIIMVKFIFKYFHL
jgi:hypothetical protein